LRPSLDDEDASLFLFARSLKEAAGGFAEELLLDAAPVVAVVAGVMLLTFSTLAISDSVSTSISQLTDFIETSSDLLTTSASRLSFLFTMSLLL